MQVRQARRYCWAKPSIRQRDMEDPRPNISVSAGGVVIEGLKEKVMHLPIGYDNLNISSTKS